MIRYKVYVWIIILSFVGGIIGITSLILLRNQVFNEHNPVESRVHHNFGTVHLKQKLKHTFNLVNPFNETLKVTNVKRSCGCGDAKLGTSEIPPLGSTSLDISLPGARAQGKMQVKTLVLAKTNKTKKSFRFIVDIEAQPSSVIEIKDSYPFIQLGKFHLDDFPIKKMLAIRKGRHPMEWDSFECRSYSNNVVATLVETTPETWNLNLELRNADCFGDIRSHLEFLFYNNGKLQPYRLVKPMQVNITGPILVSPNSLLFGAVHASEEVQKTIRLTNTQDDNLNIKIVSVKSSDPNRIKTEILGHGTEKNEISVVFSAGDKKGPCQGLIVIQAELDKLYELSTAYAAYVVD